MFCESMNSMLSAGMKRRLTALSTLAALVALGAGIARGELAQNGDLIVSLQGRVTPHALPRERLAPVQLHVDGSIRTTTGARPPRLRQFSIALNSAGQISTVGLPTCTTGELQQTTTKEALNRCRGALVGRGHFEARVSFPTVAPFPADGTLLAFNGRSKGQPAIIMHTYGAKPVQLTFVLPLTISRSANGKFGTLLSAKFPTIADESGYVTGVKFTIGRTYRYKGQTRSYLSASCAAPAGFPGAVFPFARGTFDFVTGQRLTTTLTRDCLVRR